MLETIREMPDTSDEELLPEKRVTLRGGPLDGEPITVPGLTAALVVFHEGDFHRYTVARAGGHVGTNAPLVYDAVVPPVAAGYRPRRRETDADAGG
jgi:hypothetical protein